MKQLFLLTLLASMVAVQVHAQDTTSLGTVYDSTDYQFPFKWHRLYQNVDASKATTGFLIDKAVNFINPLHHKGTLSTDNEATFDIIRSLHTALLLANTGSSVGLKDSTEVLTVIAQQYSANTINAISVMRIEYNAIREDAYDLDLLTFEPSDTSIHMGADTSQSAFVQSNLFIAAPYDTKFEQGVIPFVLSSNLIVNNTNALVDSAMLQFDRSDISYMLKPDITTPINATQFEGEVWGTLTVYFNDGKFFKTKTKFEFLAKTIPDVYASTPIQISIAPRMYHWGANLTVVLACGKKELTKPLFIVEPFDPRPSQKFTFSKIMDQLLGEAMNTELKDVLREFEKQGYDLVYIDFVDGGDAIQRNVYLFNEIVDSINKIKHSNNSTEPNVVLGIDAGAVIARMGLKQLEQANYKHETDLYLSLDGPHQGAYLPQSLMRIVKHFDQIHLQAAFTAPVLFFVSLPREVNEALYNFKCPAAQQLFIGNPFSGSFVTNAEGVITGAANKDFYEYYNSLGTLQYCREIAMTNGSIVQKNQQFGSGGFMLDNLLMASLTGQPNGHKNVWLDFRLNGLPNKQAGILFYKGRIDYVKEIKKKVFGYTILDFSIKLNLTNIEEYTQAANTLSYDNAPGGFVNVKDILDPASIKNGLGANVATPGERFCMVPTTSSLGITTDNLRYDVIANSTTTPISFGTDNFVYYVPNSTFPLFKNYSAPMASSTVNGFWNEPHGIPSAQSAFALGYELLAPTVGLPLIIDNVIYQRDSILEVLATFFPTISIDSLIKLMPLPYAALNYGYKRMVNKNELMATSGNVVHRSITFPAYIKFNINSGLPIFSPTLNNAPILIDTAFEVLGFPVILKDFPISFGRYFTSDTGSAFIVSTTGTGCGTNPITITIQDKSEMCLGSSTGNRTGTLDINNYAKVKFQSGSKLKLYNNSKIIVRKGSTLEMDQNVSIELTDANCIIELEPGAILNLNGTSHLTYTGNGFIRIEGGTGSVADNINITGSIVINGPSINQKVLELKSTNATNITVAIPNTCSGITVTNGKVVSDCMLYCDADISFTGSDVEGGMYYFYKSLESNTTNWTHGLINCFKNTKFKTGNINGQLIATNIYSGADKLYIESVLFSDDRGNGESLKIYNCKTEIKNSSFMNLGKSIQFSGMAFPTKLTGVNINNVSTFGMLATNPTGVIYNGGTGSSLSLDRCIIKQQNADGVIAENTSLSVTCSEIKTNTFPPGAAIRIKNSASVTMDPSLIPNAGKTDLSGYAVAIASNLGQDIQVNNARLNLKNSPGVPGQAFAGVVTKNYTPGVNQFYAQQNYWNWGGAPLYYNDYPYFYYVHSPSVNRAFGVGSNGTIIGNNYLTSPPNLNNLCPSTDIIPGDGGGQGKRSSYEMTNPDIVTLSDIEFNGKRTLFDAMEELFNPLFDSKLNDEKLSLCASVIEHNYEGNYANVYNGVNLAYQKMQQLVGEELLTRQFGTPSLSATKLISAQDYLLINYPLNDERRFDVQMDKILTHRIEGKLELALQQLQGLNNMDGGKHSAFIAVWDCQLSNELLLKNGAITNIEFIENISKCNPEESKINQGNEANPFAQKAIITDAVLSEDILLYPNPAKDEVDIRFNNIKGVTELRIIDIKGKILLSEKVNNIQTENVNISLSFLSQGIYMVQLVTNTNMYTQKLLIQK